MLSVNQQKLYVHPNLLILTITIGISFLKFFTSGKELRTTELSQVNLYLRLFLPGLILNECLSMEKHMFLENLFPLLYFGVLFSLCNIAGYLGIILGLQHFDLIPIEGGHLGQRTALIFSIMMNITDESGFKMLLTKDKKFNQNLKGNALINLIITMWIGYTTAFNIDKFHSEDFAWMDLLIGLSVLIVSIAIGYILGTLTSLAFANISFLRRNVITEILFFFMCLYLSSFISFIEIGFDIIAEELVLVIFGFVASHYIRYNLSLESGERLRYYDAKYIALLRRSKQKLLKYQFLLFMD